MRQKGFIHILVLAAIVVLGIFGYKAFTNSNTDWRTIKFNIWEFSVPVAWHYCTWKENSIQVRKEFQEDKTEDSALDCTVSGPVEKNAYIRVAKSTKDIDFASDNYIKILVGDEEGWLIQTVLESYPPVISTGIYVPSKTTYIGFSERDEVIDRILSSFKFHN